MGIHLGYVDTIYYSCDIVITKLISTLITKLKRLAKTFKCGELHYLDRLRSDPRAKTIVLDLNRRCGEME